MPEPPEGQIPLSTATLYILLALASNDLHGYGIMQEVAAHSAGKYKLGPGTLYDNLQKLVATNLVELSPRQDSDDPRRRYYRLTDFGKEVLAAEVRRLESVVHLARLRLESA